VRILVLEPYWGGSHRRFLEGLETHLPFRFHFLTLPARKWKWRMRFSAPWYGEQLRQLKRDDWDVIFCSTFVDVATLRALAPAWFNRVPVYTYFHENQFAYPVQVNDERDFHFALTNMTTAMASDYIAFNSNYNLETFIDGCRKMVRLAPDMKLSGVDSLAERAVVLSPGIDFSGIDAEDRSDDLQGAVLVWNHRWEHDKNPDLFFQTLMDMAEDISFSLMVFGQSFQRKPDIFKQVPEKLASRLSHFGFVDDVSQYYRMLRQGSLVVSTASHEFYGISVLEAVRAGCRPLLPARLSYPGIFPDRFLYDDGEFARRLVEDMALGPLTDDEALALTESHSLALLAKDYERWFTEKQ